MNEYYQKLVEAECRHIRETVKITVYEGQAAIEHSQRELAARNATVDCIKRAIAIDPKTGRATDMPAFVTICHDIVDLPTSCVPLDIALFDITETARSQDYPREDRAAICDALHYTMSRGHLDSCTYNQLYKAQHTLRRVDDRTLAPAF